MGWYEALKDLAKAAQVTDNAELISAANDAWKENQELRAKLDAANQRVSELTEQLERAGVLELRDNVLWTAGDPVPFCRVCHEASGRLLHLDVKAYSWACPSCKNAWTNPSVPAPPPIRVRRYI